MMIITKGMKEIESTIICPVCDRSGWRKIETDNYVCFNCKITDAEILRNIWSVEAQNFIDLMYIHIHGEEKSCIFDNGKILFNYKKSIQYGVKCPLCGGRHWVARPKYACLHEYGKEYMCTNCKLATHIDIYMKDISAWICISLEQPGKESYIQEIVNGRD